MRTSLGVLLAALAVGGCSIALDMDRFGKGDEAVANNDVKETGSNGGADASTPSIDGGTSAPPTGDTTPKSNPPPDGGLPEAPPPCTRHEDEPNSNESDGEIIGLGTTMCGQIMSPNDADWFEYSINTSTTLTIDSHPSVTATLYRNGSAFESHVGGKRTYAIATGRIQIWLVGNGPGMLAYRVTVK